LASKNLGFQPLQNAYEFQHKKTHKDNFQREIGLHIFTHREQEKTNYRALEMKLKLHTTVQQYCRFCFKNLIGMLTHGGKKVCTGQSI
jgi:hypothetical protein